MKSRADGVMMSRWVRWVPVVLVAGLLVPLPDVGRVGRSVFDLLHAPAFAAVAYLVAGRARSVGRVFGFWLGLTVLGVIIEAVQAFVGRSASWQDAAANGLGAGGGIALFYALRCRGWKRAGATAAAIALLIVPQVDPLLELWDVRMQRIAFPVLAAFESEHELRRWQADEGTAIRRVERDGAGALCAELAIGADRGVDLEWPSADWTGYDTLETTLVLDDGPPLPLRIKVFDETHREHDYAYKDRFEQEVRCGAGRQTIVLSLEEIRTAPAGRQMDLTRIARVEWIVDVHDAPRVMLIERVRLGRGRVGVE